MMGFGFEFFLRHIVHVEGISYFYIDYTIVHVVVEGISIFDYTVQYSNGVRWVTG